MKRRIAFDVRAGLGAFLHQPLVGPVDAKASRRAQSSRRSAAAAAPAAQGRSFAAGGNGAGAPRLCASRTSSLPARLGGFIELAGWIAGMNSYNDAGRAFWVEAYGGRPYRVERVKRSGHSRSVWRSPRRLGAAPSATRPIWTAGHRGRGIRSANPSFRRSIPCIGFVKRLVETADAGLAGPFAIGIDVSAVYRAPLTGSDPASHHQGG